MKLKLNKSILVIANWSSSKGRHYVHEDEPSICLTCPERPQYSHVCQAKDHQKQTTRHTTVEEAAPEEAKKVQSVYGQVHRKLKEKGHHIGDAVYLFADAEIVNTIISEVRTELNEINASLSVCKADFRFTIVEILPDATHEETLRSLRDNVKEAVDQIINALNEADRDAMRKAVKDTQNLAALLDDDARRQMKSMAHFTSRMAERLKVAAKEGEDAITEAMNEIKQGAARWSNVSAELEIETNVVEHEVYCALNPNHDGPCHDSTS